MSNISLHTSSGMIEQAKFFKSSFIKDREEVQEYSVSLDRDPSSKSPAQLYLKLHIAREYSNRVSVLLLQYMKAYISVNNMVLRKDEERKVRIQSLYVIHQKELTSFRSTEEKNNYCLSFFTEEEKSYYIELKSLLEQLKGYHQYFKVKYEILSSTKNDILTQLGIIRSMIMLGELQLVNSLEPSRDISSDDLPNELKEGSIDF